MLFYHQQSILEVEVFDMTNTTYIVLIYNITFMSETNVISMDKYKVCIIHGVTVFMSPPIVCVVFLSSMLCVKRFFLMDGRFQWWYLFIVFLLHIPQKQTSQVEYRPSAHITVDGRCNYIESPISHSSHTHNQLRVKKIN